MKGEDLPGRGETIGKDLEVGDSLVVCRRSLGSWGAAGHIQVVIW